MPGWPHPARLLKKAARILRVAFAGAGRRFMSQDEILLFYDGYERRAEPHWALAPAEAARRHARFAYKTLRRQQTRTGFYTWFLMLVEALERAGHCVRVNDFQAARRNPSQPIGAAGYHSVLAKLDGLPNPRLVGPGLYASPLENAALFDDPRNRFFLQTCDWAEAMFRPWYGERMRRWFGGFDVTRFADTRGGAKSIDVLIYDKIYFDRERFLGETLARFIPALEAAGLSYKIMRYGAHHYADYIAALAASRSMAFFAHSETQGMAYQECLASNVPIFAWDEGFWPNPMAAQLSSDPIPCTSVPYFDARCGVRFTAAGMSDAWARFWPARDSFSPRAFIAEEMTFEKSAEAYVRAYRETGGGDLTTPRSPQPPSAR